MGLVVMLMGSEILFGGSLILLIPVLGVMLLFHHVGEVFSKRVDLRVPVSLVARAVSIAAVKEEVVAVSAFTEVGLVVGIIVVESVLSKAMNLGGLVLVVVVVGEVDGFLP